MKVENLGKAEILSKEYHSNIYLLSRINIAIDKAKKIESVEKRSIEDRLNDVTYSPSLDTYRSILKLLSADLIERQNCISKEVAEL